jgi:hypothetical protein
VGVLAHQRGLHLALVYLQHDGPRLFYSVWQATAKDCGSVVEDTDGAIRQTPGIVLEGETGARTHLEVALLAAETPYDLTRLAVYLVDG